MNIFQEAVDYFTSKTPVTGALSSADWSQIATGLADRALFVSRVTNAQFVQSFSDQISNLVTAKTDVASARLAIKQALQSLGYQPAEEDRGTIKDLSTDGRINLVLKQNVESAQGYGDWQQGQSEGALSAFPAQELYRLEARKVPRDWITRWDNARGELGAATTALDARVAMIALKADPIWVQISAFGVPWPPFDFNSGMWVRDVGRKRAEELGLISPGQKPPSNLGSFNDELQASVSDLSAEMIASLKAQFGNQIDIAGGVAKWRGK